MTRTLPRPVLPTLGWREWAALPELGIPRIKAKLDTGARSSSLHAFDLRTYDRDGKEYVRFKVHPAQRDTKATITAEAEILEYRQVRSSSGHRSRRPVILTALEIFGERWVIELTLANRDEMGFRLLLGREAIRGHGLVDAGRSFLGGRPPQAQRKKKKRTKKTTKKKTRVKKKTRMRKRTDQEE